MALGQEFKKDNRTEPTIRKLPDQNRSYTQTLVASATRMLTLVSEEPGAKAKEESGLVNKAEKAPAQTAKLLFLRTVAANGKATAHLEKQVLKQSTSEKTPSGRLTSDFSEPW